MDITRVRGWEKKRLVSVHNITEGVCAGNTVVSFTGTDHRWFTKSLVHIGDV